MGIGKVNFGKVIAVSGKPRMMDKLNNSLVPYVNARKIMIKDVTSIYKDSFTDGLLGQAAQRGEKVSIYVTEEDVSKVRKKEKNWNTLDGILSNLQAYYNLATMSTRDVLDKLIKN